MAHVPIFTNFTEYFREERDIFVQNLSNTQVSLQVEINDRVESALLPRGKKPLNLTNMLPFAAIKGSVDLRKLVNRRPPVLVLMSEEDYMEYYHKIAAAEGKTVAEVMDDAHQYQSDLQNKRAFTKPVPEPRKTLEEAAEEREKEPEDPQDKLSPRVVGLCSGVGDDVKESDRIGEAEMLAELKDLELTRGDLEFLLGRGFYTSVKKYAQQQMNS